jgi:hypothetical protein
MLSKVRPERSAGCGHVAVDDRRHVKHRAGDAQPAPHRARARAGAAILDHLRDRYLPTLGLPTLGATADTPRADYAFARSSATTTSPAALRLAPKHPCISRGALGSACWNSRWPSS